MLQRQLSPISIEIIIIIIIIIAGACECGEEPSGSTKRRGISWLAANQLASQEGLCFMQ
jgi:hypothetical protein